MTFDKQILTKIANMYYKEDLTQNQIAKLLGYSRVKISRLLKKARDEGIVQITIDYSDLHTELEQQVARAYGIQNVLIVNPDTRDITSAIAESAAHYLNNTLTKQDIIAVGFGNTMSRMTEYTHGDFNESIIFSPIIGGHGRTDFELHSSTIASNLANRFHGKANSLLAPAFAKSVDEKNIYIKDSYVQDVLTDSRNANKAIFSVGSFEGQNFTLAKTGYFTDLELETIMDSNPVCEVSSVAFLSHNAEQILTAITDRSIGISSQELKQVPNKICVAGTKRKHKSIKAALDAGYVNTLITDLQTAKYLMQQ